MEFEANRIIGSTKSRVQVIKLNHSEAFSELIHTYVLSPIHSYSAIYYQ